MKKNITIPRKRKRRSSDTNKNKKQEAVVQSNKKSKVNPALLPVSYAPDRKILTQIFRMKYMLGVLPNLQFLAARALVLETRVAVTATLKLTKTVPKRVWPYLLLSTKKRFKLYISYVNDTYVYVDRTNSPSEYDTLKWCVNMPTGSEVNRACWVYNNSASGYRLSNFTTWTKTSVKPANKEVRNKNSHKVVYSFMYQGRVNNPYPYNKQNKQIDVRIKNCKDLIPQYLDPSRSFQSNTTKGAITNVLAVRSLSDSPPPPPLAKEVLLVIFRRRCCTDQWRTCIAINSVFTPSCSPVREIVMNALLWLAIHGHISAYSRVWQYNVKQTDFRSIMNIDYIYSKSVTYYNSLFVLFEEIIPILKELRHDPDDFDEALTEDDSPVPKVSMKTLCNKLPHLERTVLISCMQCLEERGVVQFQWRSIPLNRTNWRVQVNGIPLLTQLLIRMTIFPNENMWWNILYGLRKNSRGGYTRID